MYSQTLQLTSTLLCSCTVVWRQEELDRINQTTSGAERKAALCMLLEQEAHLIASIGKHKISAKEDMREDQIRKFLDTVSVTQSVSSPYIVFICF